MSSLTSISDATGLDIIPQLQVPSSLSLSLSCFLTEMQEEEENQDGTSGISLWEGANPTALSAAGLDFGPWGDAETKSFYEDLPGAHSSSYCTPSAKYSSDLLSMVPLTVLGMSPEQVSQ
jgi:hypothetical protein